MAAKIFRASKRDPFNVPELNDVSPRFAALSAKRSEILAKVAELQAERLRIIRAAPKAYGDNGSRIYSSNQAARDLAGKVAHVLGDLVPLFMAEQPAPAEPMPKDRLQAIDAEIEVLETAAAALMVPMDEARVDASRLVCEQFADQHKAIVLHAAQAISSLYAAVGTYRDLMTAITTKGFKIDTLNVVPLGGIVGFGGCAITDLVKRAKAQKLISDSDVPEGLF